MIHKIDGDQLMLAANSFQNLQESPAVFIPLDCDLAKEILAEDEPQESKRERLAEYAHEAWSGWMKWMFERGGTEMLIDTEGLKMHVWTMSPSSFKRWQRQMNTEFKALPENEKESDRAEADKMLAIVNNASPSR